MNNPFESTNGGACQLSLGSTHRRSTRRAASPAARPVRSPARRGQRRDLRRVVVLFLLRPVLIIYVEISFTHEPLECVAEWPTSALDEFVDELA